MGDLMTGDWIDYAGGIAAIVGALASLIAAIGTVLNGRSGAMTQTFAKQGVAVSTRNEDALTTVRLKQDTNKTEIKTEIQGIRHDVNNGLKDAIAAATMEHIVPVLDAQTKDINKAAEVVAARLAEIKGWDGTERRTGPKDRRQLDANETEPL